MKIFWELVILKNVVFLSRPFWIFFFRKKKIFFAFFPWKQVKVYWLARMGQNFDQGTNVSLPFAWITGPRKRTQLQSLLVRMGQNFDPAKHDNTFWPRPNILTGSVRTCASAKLSPSWTGSPPLTRFSNNTVFWITRFVLELSFVHLVLNHSSAYTVFCLHGCFSKVLKKQRKQRTPCIF